MRLSQLRFLVELKKHKTISETAQKLYISQPSLSTAIKELEEELGFDIIERSNKGVKFTKRGELVLKYSRDVMQSVNGIERLSKNKEHSHKNYITIASIYYIFQSVVMESFLDFKERYPDVQVSLREENSYDIVQMLINKEIDPEKLQAQPPILKSHLKAKREENKGKNIVVLLPDTGSRYLSTELV